MDFQGVSIEFLCFFSCDYVYGICGLLIYVLCDVCCCFSCESSKGKAKEQGGSK